MYIPSPSPPSSCQLLGNLGSCLYPHLERFAVWLKWEGVGAQAKCSLLLQRIVPGAELVASGLVYIPTFPIHGET